MGLDTPAKPPLPKTLLTSCPTSAFTISPTSSAAIYCSKPLSTKYLFADCAISEPGVSMGDPRQLSVLVRLTPRVFPVLTGVAPLRIEPKLSGDGASPTVPLFSESTFPVLVFLPPSIEDVGLLQLPLNELKPLLRLSSPTRSPRALLMREFKLSLRASRNKRGLFAPGLNTSSLHAARPPLE